MRSLESIYNEAYKHAKERYGDISVMHGIALFEQCRNLMHFTYVSDMEKNGEGEAFDREDAKLLKGINYIGDCDCFAGTATTTAEKIDICKPNEMIEAVTCDHYIAGFIDREIEDVWIVECNGYSFTPKAMTSDFMLIQDMPNWQQIEHGYIIPEVYKLSELQKGYIEEEVRGDAFMIPSRVKQFKMEQFRLCSDPLGATWYDRRSDLPFIKGFDYNRCKEGFAVDSQGIRRYPYTKEWKLHLKLSIVSLDTDIDYDSERAEGDRLHASASVGGLNLGSIKRSEKDGDFEPIMIEKRKKIALVVGHRAGKQGAVNAQGKSEYMYWSEYLENELENFQQNIDAQFKIFYRSDAVMGGYTHKMDVLAKEINEWGADVAISFHFNAAANPNASGFEVLCSKSRGSKAYAKQMIEQMDKSLWGDNRGVKVRKRGQRGGGFLYKTKMPAMILEPYFGSSSADTRTFNENIGSFTTALMQFFRGMR